MRTEILLLFCTDLIGSDKLKIRTEILFSFQGKEQPDQTELDWYFFWQCAPILRRRRSPPAPWCSSRRLRSNSSRCRGVVGCVCHFRFTKKKSCQISKKKGKRTQRKRTNRYCNKEDSRPERTPVPPKSPLITGPAEGLKIYKKLLKKSRQITSC